MITMSLESYFKKSTMGMRPISVRIYAKAQSILIVVSFFVLLYMNLISSCAFACTAAFVYKRRHTLSGAVMGLCCGWSSMVIVMLLWNYIIAPIYMDYPREEITGLLFTAFLPFNLIKGGLNAGGTMLLYKPVVTALRRSHLLEPAKNTEKARPDKGVILASLLIIITCILFVLSFNKVL